MDQPPITTSESERVGPGPLEFEEEHIPAAVTSERPRAQIEDEGDPDRFLAKLLERLGNRFGYARLVQLLKNRGDVVKTFRALPDRMHLVANQTRLIIELVDDYRTGAYRQIPWRSLLVLAGGAAYVLSPLDLIPDVLTGLGILDDMLLMALAARLMRKDLETYCRFKGYPLEDYF